METIDIRTQRGKDHTSDSQRTSHDSPLYNKANTQKLGTVLSWKTPALISRSNFVRVSNLWRVFGGGVVKNVDISAPDLHIRSFSLSIFSIRLDIPHASLFLNKPIKGVTGVFVTLP